MNQGPATKKMLELVGEEACELAMSIYSIYKPFMGKDTGAETILAELTKVQKGLHELQKRGYLTDQGEFAVYDSLLQNLSVYEKPRLLFDLILRIHSRSKTGSIPQYGLASSIFILKFVYEAKKSKKHFWPILSGFLHEQGIKQTEKTNPDEEEIEQKGKVKHKSLKKFYHDYAKKLNEFAFNHPNYLEERGTEQAGEPGPYEDFIRNYEILKIIVSLQTFPKHERAEKIQSLLSPKLMREYLKHKKITYPYLV
jgi:hypothetical protein